MSPSVPAILAEALQHHRAGRLRDAERLYRQALSLAPRHADALHLLGMIAQQTGRPDLAIQTIGQAIAVSPVTPFYHLSLGNVLGEQGRLSDAIGCFDQAIALKPDLAEAHNSRGTALVRLGQPGAAAAAFAQAIAHKPDFADAHNNLGNILGAHGQVNEAIAACRTALALRPDFAEAHLNLGNALFTQGRLEEAAACFQQAIAFRPAYAEAHNNLGNIRKEQGQTEQALTHYGQAVALDPGYLHAHSNLLFCQNYLPNRSPDVLREMARRFGDLITGRATNPFTAWPLAPHGKPLRVGVVSSDLRRHPVGFFLEALLRAADPARIVFLAFPSHPAEDDQTARLKLHFVSWQSIHALTDANAAAVIHASAVEILLDLSGHTANNRLPLFAYRPAPVQATWLGYFATTGVAEIDYFIGDPNVAPPREAHHFTETVWRLPETYLCFTPPDPPVPVSALPALTNGFITFGCFNNATKINDTVVAVWSRVLLAVPGSRLMLKAAQLGDPALRTVLQTRFTEHGIAPDRIRVDPPSDRGDYLLAYHDVDIVLDPFPYPGGTTSVEALWMGLPVLTRRGDRFLSHLGETILINAGLPDWIAADDDDYMAKAARFAADRDALAALRARLRAQVLASPLFDAPRFARHFQEAMSAMWARWLFTQALRHHQAERPDEAEPLYRRSLAENPHHADAHHLLGLIAQQKGDLDRAAATVEQAISVRPFRRDCQNFCVRGVMISPPLGKTESIQPMACPASS